MKFTIFALIKYFPLDSPDLFKFQEPILNHRQEDFIQAIYYLNPFYFFIYLDRNGKHLHYIHRPSFLKGFMHAKENLIIFVPNKFPRVFLLLFKFQVRIKFPQIHYHPTVHHWI